MPGSAGSCGGAGIRVTPGPMLVGRSAVVNDTATGVASRLVTLRRPLTGIALACAVLVLASAASTAPLAVAPDRRGAPSPSGLARTDCLGAARTPTSKVWL